KDDDPHAITVVIVRTRCEVEGADHDPLFLGFPELARVAASRRHAAHAAAHHPGHAHAATAANAGSHRLAVGGHAAHAAAHVAGHAHHLGHAAAHHAGYWGRGRDLLLFLGDKAGDV